jgi:hypothetical protein
MKRLPNQVAFFIGAQSVKKPFKIESCYRSTAIVGQGIEKVQTRYCI